MSTERVPRLGRGLQALLSARPHSEDREDRRPGNGSALRQIPLSEIRPNSLQPRKHFAEADLQELSASIRSNGLLQPITVRRVDDGFELIAGERRLRAVQLLGWQEVPAIVKDGSIVGDRESLTLALVENLQRTDLNPLEEAEGYQVLLTQFGLKQQEVADVVGKERSTVANVLRLLALPAVVRRMVRDGALSLGHARALLALADEHRMVELARVVVADGLSVREVERRVRDAGAQRKVALRSLKPATDVRPAEVARIEGQLRRHLQTEARIHLNGKDAGEVRIAFYSADDLERLLDLMLGPARAEH